MSYRVLLKSACGMLLQLGVDSRFVYDEDFEQYLLEETRIFYQVCYTSLYNFVTCIIN